MKTRFAAIALFLATFASAAQTLAVAKKPEPASKIVARGPYDLSKLRGICAFVYSRARAPAESGYHFRYEQMMAEAAGVTSNDDEEVRRTRMRYLWLDNQDAFRCTADNFNVTYGNALKYSARSKSFDLLNSAIEEWQLEFNFIDPADRRTLLDYLANQAEANAGNSQQNALVDSYDAVRSLGAKHCFELIDPKHCRDPDSSSFINDGQFDSDQRLRSDNAIAEHNERVRLAPLRPYRAL